MNKKKVIKAVSIAAGAAAAAAAGVWAAARMFVRSAMDRDVPKSMLKLSGSGKRFQMGDPSGLSRDPEDARRLEAREHETVTIAAFDGEYLAAHWFPAEQPERVVICLHGWRTIWSRDFGLMADFLFESGCSVLFPEQRGQNASGGDTISFGVTEQYDVADWIRWVRSRCGFDIPLYLFGISMGAFTAVISAEGETAGEIRGIIADCGYTSPEAIWRYVTEDKLHLPFRLFRPLAERQFRQRTGAGLADLSAPDTLNRTEIPVLFIHGGSDRFIPEGMSRANASAAKNGRLLIVPGAPHALSYLVDPEAYESAVRAFWEDCE